MYSICVFWHEDRNQRVRNSKVTHTYRSVNQNSKLSSTKLNSPKTKVPMALCAFAVVIFSLNCPISWKLFFYEALLVTSSNALLPFGKHDSDSLAHVHSGSWTALSTTTAVSVAVISFMWALWKSLITYLSCSIWCHFKTASATRETLLVRLVKRSRGQETLCLFVFFPKPHIYYSQWGVWN